MIEIPASASLEALLARYPALQPLEAALGEAFSMLASAVAAGGKILVCGNGGSAADAEHMVGELVKSFAFRRPLPGDQQAALQAHFGDAGRELAQALEGAIPAISLVGHVALNSAIANDTGYVYGFAQQVCGLGRPGDVLVGISTSGRSKNVLHACRVARVRGMGVLGLSGSEARALGELSDVVLRAPSEQTHIIQEYHLPMYHWLCFALEAHFFGQHGLR